MYGPINKASHIFLKFPEISTVEERKKERKEFYFCTSFVIPPSVCMGTAHRFKVAAGGRHAEKRWNRGGLLASRFNGANFCKGGQSTKPLCVSVRCPSFVSSTCKAKEEGGI